jgi:hypothetical protein
MLLANSHAAAARLAPFAAMSALVYEDLPDCLTCGEPKLSDKDRQYFEKSLAEAGWNSNHPSLKQPNVTDSLGTYYRVWTRTREDALEVVVAFRGTDGGIKDWTNGNLRWITRIFPGEDQYQASRRYMGEIVEFFESGAGKPAENRRVRYFTTGHSLGGGLAQNALYTFPDLVLQAFAFDPSPVTGFRDNAKPVRRAGCDCRWKELGGEARVYRIFDRKDVLAKARFLLKLALPLNRQIQEVRFDTGAGHSVAKLARELGASAGRFDGVATHAWFAGLPDIEGEDCSKLFTSALETSCTGINETRYCPR